METRNIKITLLFDLDDTLIENAAHFLEVKTSVATEIAKLNHGFGLSIPEMIQGFDEREHQNAQSGHGYGYQNFRVSILEQSYFYLGYTFFKYRLYEFIDYQIDWLEKRPVQLVEGVLDTIVELKKRGYPLWILTKGETQDQRSKLQNTGITRYFDHIEIMSDKSPESYEQVVGQYGLKAEACYMIGNSPKSDINNAKKIGLRTIFIPNSSTWKSEIEQISSEEPKTIVLDSFSGLLELDFEKARLESVTT